MHQQRVAASFWPRSTEPITVSLRVISSFRAQDNLNLVNMHSESLLVPLKRTFVFCQEGINTVDILKHLNTLLFCKHHSTISEP